MSSDSDPATPVPPTHGACRCCAGEVLGVALLHELSDMRVRLRLDADRSGAFDRLLGKLGAYERLAASLAANGAVYDPSHAPERAAARRIVRLHMALLSRLEDPHAADAPVM